METDERGCRGNREKEASRFKAATLALTPSRAPQKQQPAHVPQESVVAALFC